MTEVLALQAEGFEGEITRVSFNEQGRLSRLLAESPSGMLFAIDITYPGTVNVSLGGNYTGDESFGYYPPRPKVTVSHVLL